MKLVCDACAAKYSISDDKVAGKIFKIRCKKCSHVIVVRGGVEAPVASVEAPPSAADDWHAVVDGQQIGPFDSREVSRRRAAGELDDDSYVWREGMTDWAPLGSIDALRDAPRDADAPREPVADVTRLRGERNESSVLFTLGNLAKLAAPPPTTSATTTAAAVTEGSGLIDIRALASTLTAPVAKPATTGSMADLPVFTPSGFADPIVLVASRPPTPDRRLVIALVALVAMLVVVATVLVVVVIGGSTNQAVTKPAPTELAATPAIAALPTPAAAAPASPPAPAAAAPPPTAAAPAPAPASSAPAPASSAPAPTSPPRRTPSAPRRTPSTTSSTPATSSRPAEHDKCTDVSCAFSNYAEKCCVPFKPAATHPTQPQGELPDNLDRGMLTAGIATIDAQACAGRSAAHGDVSVSIKVSPAGAVTRVTIKSSPDPTLSSCVTAAAQKGTFAKTKRGGTFAYVWRL